MTPNRHRRSPLGAGGLDQVHGFLPSGTAYLIRMPTTWNGVLINDLDFAARAIEQRDNDWYRYLYRQGYATSGTARRPDRRATYDPAAEIEDQVKVLDLVDETFGRPSRIIQYGCSGGGNVAMGIGETYPDRVHGVIPVSYQTTLVLHNMRLDLLFALAALLAPRDHLPLADVPDDEDQAVHRWQKVLEAARQNDLGRARIALAVTLAQWPAWGSAEPSSTPRPGPGDDHAFTEAVAESAHAGVETAIRGRARSQLSAGGRASWNTGVDYADFYRNADPQQQGSVQALYWKAGLEFQSDLDRINDHPRIAADADAVAYWKVHPRTHSGRPEVPVLHMHATGDAALPPALMQGYAARVAAEGKTDLYRQVLIEANSHCRFRTSELATAIDAMTHRLDTGRWDTTTDTQVMNAHARSLDLDEPRFVHTDLPTLNRAFYADSRYP